MKYYFLIAFIGLGITSCKPKFEEPEMSAGEINPTRFVMVGGAHTAGYMDDALYFDGQENSLANLIAGQLEKVGGGSFYQPLVSANSVGVNLNGLSKLKLGYKTDCENVASLSPLRVAATGDLSIWSDNLYNANSHFGNYGVPGLKVSDAFTANYAAQNNYFNRMKSAVSASVMEDAMAQNPTFFSLFLGLDDVMAYAKAGGKGQTLPTVLEFQSDYTAVVEGLISSGAKGVLATIPDVTKMPYFNTIPYNGLALTEADAGNLDLLNNVYNPLGYFFDYGNNPFMMVDSTANDFAVRQLLPGEYLLLSLPLDSVKCHQVGVLYPFRDEFVLSLQEVNLLRSRITAYNQVITNLSNQFGLALVRTDEFIGSLSDGFVYNGVSMSAKFVSGGAYSLDGIHLNARGNAVLANQFIKAINSKYKARIPAVNATATSAILFP
jgi:hypothetical protein